MSTLGRAKAHWKKLERYVLAYQVYMATTKLSGTYSDAGRPDSVRRLRAEASGVLEELQVEVFR